MGWCGGGGSGGGGGGGGGGGVSGMCVFVSLAGEKTGLKESE